MARKQTSPTVSTIAARLMRLNSDQLADYVNGIGWAKFADEVRSVAASAVAQDETPGQENAPDA